MNRPSSERAVVLGAGISGLVAATVLARHFASVTIIDRDTLPETADDRHGVPQGRHAHALLAGGQQVLERLYPGITSDLVADGAVLGDVLADVRMRLNGHRLCRADADLVVVSASRPFLEAHVRTRVTAMPNVRIIDRTDAVGLQTSADGRRVTGVHVLARTDDSAAAIVDAALVVDATGCRSRTPAWLSALGFDRPAEERVRIDVAYATRNYRLDAGVLGGDVAILHAPTPDHPRGGVLARIEHGRAMVTLAGVHGDHRPPTDPAGFQAFAETLTDRSIAAAIGDSEPLDDPVPYRFAASTWRHYERLSRFPEGYAVIGDSMCSVNPIYGQGMTIGALQSVALDDHLARHGRLRPRHFHRDVARIVKPAWQMTVGADVLFPGSDRCPTAVERAVGRYIARFHAAAAGDARLARSFVRVSGLVDPPPTLLRPVTVARVYRRRPARRADPS